MSHYESLVALLVKVAIMAPPAVLAITLHEAAHGWIAHRLGDNTAYRLGRVTANPLRHIDPIGTFLVPALTYAFAGLIFGWAKPVPVNFGNLRNPHRDMFWVALAGPGSNLLMALAWGLSIYVGLAMIEAFPLAGYLTVYSGVAGVLFNALLMVLNLMPILPLDGGRMLTALLPRRLAAAYSRLEPFGILILLLLLVSGLLGTVLFPLLGLTVALLPGSEVVATLAAELFR